MGVRRSGEGVSGGYGCVGAGKDGSGSGVVGQAEASLTVVHAGLCEEVLVAVTIDTDSTQTLQMKSENATH